MLEIVIYTEGLPFDGETPFARSLGGSESAVVFMARELARRGHGVRVFCRCQRPGDYDGVVYRDLTAFPEFVETDGCDVFVCCRHLRGLTAPVRSRVNVVWNHDLLVKQTAGYLASLMFRVDRLFVLSEFHRQQFRRHLEAPEHRYLVTRNGVDLALVDEAITGVERDPDRVMYTSRPERGLDVLLTMWPEIRERRPDLKLAIAHYDNPGADAQMADYLETLRRVAGELPGVTMLGGLSKRELYRELARSALVLYPSVFPEVSCISALEAAACGTPMVASRYCALKESVADDETGALIPGNPREQPYQAAFVRAVADLLGDEAPRAEMGAAARRRIEERYQWRTIAEEWEGVLERAMAGTHAPARGTAVAGGTRLPQKRQSVSVCMIVKDGQGTLYRCLESVKPIADEIIVCDTGSRDRSMEIAGEYTDQVFSLPWEDDFAAARNRSIAQARGDWILWLDADEYLVGTQHLGKYLRDNMYNGYVIRQHHHAVDAEFKPDVPVRLFRNHRGVKFYGCVHEHPETELNAGVRPSVILSDVHIVHDGYVTEEIRRRRFLRNLPLLMKDRRRHPGRRLGLVFLERDYVHLARYELERTHGVMTEKAQGYLQRAAAIHRGHFRSPDDPLHGYSLPLYQSALELLGEGFVVECALGLGRDGRAGAAPLPNAERRRVLDEAEAREFLEWRLAELLKEARAEEEVAFEEPGG
jgi:glycosyltransferase involved in cell wall biosynthesis